MFDHERLTGRHEGQYGRRAAAKVLEWVGGEDSLGGRSLFHRCGNRDTKLIRVLSAQGPELWHLDDPRLDGAREYGKRFGVYTRDFAETLLRHLVVIGGVVNRAVQDMSFELVRAGCETTPMF